ncbi:zinc ribbon-containing protein [bacterium]|nr:zinc ribbon-containing protein [bacterium]
MAFVTGEKPGVGTFACATCWKRLRLDQKSDNLPPCPRCHGTIFIKVG